MSTIDDKITDLEAKLKQAKAKKQQVESRQKFAASKIKKASDDQKKILIGAAILSRVELNTWPLDRLISMMDSFLIRPKERALFDLPPKPTTPKPDDQKSSPQT